jgi:nicotinate phosphoribosyltransferase
VMKTGRRLQPPEPLSEIKQRAKRELERLPEALRRLGPDAKYPVEVAPALQKLATEVDRRLHLQKA